MRTAKNERIQTIIQYLKAKSTVDNETNIGVLLDNALSEEAFSTAWNKMNAYKRNYITIKLTHQLGKIK